MGEFDLLTEQQQYKDHTSFCTNVFDEQHKTIIDKNFQHFITGIKNFLTSWENFETE